MAEVVIPGPLSGRRYGFRIAGEQPTADEQRRIDAILRQREAQFGQEYQAQFAQPLPGAEGSGLLDYLGEIPKGVLRGITGLGERAALGAATLLPERFEAPTREGILGASRYLQSGLQPDVGFVGNRTAEGIARLSEGLGSTAPFFALAPLGIGGIAAGAALGGGAGAGEASERARTGDATEAQRAQATFAGLGVGLSEVAVPVALRGLFGSLLRAGVPRTTIMARLGRIGTAATAEGAQEAAAEFLQNAIEQGIYNPEQDLQEGLLPAAGTGAGVGAIIQGLVELGTRSRGPAAPSAPPAPPILALPSPSAFPSPPAPSVISVPPGPGQVSGGPGSNVPGARATPPAAASRAAATPPSTPPSTPPAAGQPSSGFDVDATTDALRSADGNYVTAMRDLKITYPELQQRVRHLESIGRVRFDRVSGRMFFDAPATPPSTPPAAATPTSTPPAAASRAPFTGPISDAEYRALSDADKLSYLDEVGLPPVPPAAASRAAATPPATPSAATPATAPTQEITDAETAPRGPVGSDAAPDRVGTERDLTEPAAQPVARDAGPSAADAPVGGAVGEPLLGARETSVAEGEQPAALTPGPALWASKDADIPVNVMDVAPMAGPDGRMYQQVSDPETGALSFVPQDEIVQATPAARMERGLPPVGEPTPARQLIPGTRVRVDPRTLQPTSKPFARPEDLLLTDPPIAPAPAPAPTAPVFPTTKEAMLSELDAIGIGPRVGVRTMVRNGDITTPESFIAALGKAQIRDAAVSQRRDARIAEIREALRTAAADPAADRVVAAIVEAQQQGEAMQRLAVWFDKNATDDLKLAAELEPDGRETETLPARDVRAIVALLETTQDKGGVTPEAAAVRYFGRTNDPGYALHAIASDAAQARGEEGAREVDVRTKIRIFGTGFEPETDNDRATLALLVGQGWKPAQSAEQWVKENLSPATYARLIALQSTGATTDRAGYAWINYSARAAGRDSVSGLTSAGRVGPAQAVSEPTAEQQEARKKKVALDREALEETARQFLGLSPAQWGAMDAPARQDRVNDYIDLKDMAREPSAPQTPEDAPVRRALPRRTKTAEQQAQEDAEAVQAALNNAAEGLSFFAGQTEWMSDAHPRVAQLIRGGDFKGALHALAITAPSKHLRGLAQKLLARIGTTPVQVVSPDVMNSIRAQLSPETPTLGVETPAGVYVHPRNEAQIAAMRREGHDVAADLTEQYGGQILFNENSPLAPELVLHEAVHAVADATLTNLSHVLTRQLDKLRTNLLKFMPANEYGLSNVRELLAEGLNNPVFRRNMSSVNTEGKPYSAWQEFKHIMRNFLRTLMGQPTVKPDSALTTLDRVLNAVLASNPNEIDAGNIVGASFAPGGLNRYLNATRDRLKEAPGITQAQTRRIMQDVTIPPGVKDVAAAFVQTLSYAGEAAAKYMPTATEVNGAVRQFEGEKDRMQTELNASLQPIVDTLNKYDTPAQQATLDEWQKVRLLAQLFEVDVRKPRSTYEGYSYAHNVLDADGNIVKIVESSHFKTEGERNSAMQAFNAKLAPDAPKAARARVKFDEDAKNLAGFDTLRPMWDRMPADLRDALNRSYAIPEVLRKKLDGAIRAQLDVLMPGNKKLQMRIYGQFYAKIMADKLIPSYQHLRRSGEYWLTFNSYDPITGTTELVKTSFLSLRKQQIALGMIERHNDKYYAELQTRLGDNRPLDVFKRAVQGTPANPETGAAAVPGLIIRDAINQAAIEKTTPMLQAAPYQNVGADRNRPTVSLEFFAKILDSIDASAEIAAIDAARGSTDVKVKDQLFEIFFDTTPETSFLKQFQKRAGRRGFDGDINALQEGEGVGDIVANIAESNRQLARQVIKLKYGAIMSGLRRSMEKEFNTFQKSSLRGVTPEKRAREIDEAARYLSALSSYTRAVFQDTASWASAATGIAYTAALGFNPSTAALTTMSLPMFTAPYLGGKYGYRPMMAAMSDGLRALSGTGKYRQVERIGPDGQPETAAVKMGIFDFSMDNQDYSRPELQWKTPLHTAMKENGMLYRSMTHDEMQATDPGFVQKIAGWASIFQHTAERYVKETSAHAAYILELQQLMGATAQDTKAFIADLKAGRKVPTAEQGAAAGLAAVNITEKTNGPTFASQRPRMAQSDVGRVAYLFKGHPFAMLNLLWQTAQRSLGPKTPDRSIARAQLTGMLSTLGAVGGIMGLPMMQQVAMLHDLLWAEDDEPDFETKVRILAGEQGAFGLLDFLLGVKVSNRLGLGDAIYRPALGSETDAPLFKLLEGFGGPVLGLAMKYLSPRTWAHYNEGRYDRFVETLLPSAAANVARSWRYFSDGIENKRGDIVVDDIGPFHIAAQAFGFMPTAYAQRLAMNSLGTRINNAIERKVSLLLQRRNKAIIDGDRAAQRDAEAAIREFQQRHPGRIDRDTLNSSIRAFRDRTAQTNYGLYIPPRNRAYIEGILDDIGIPTLFE